VNKNIPNLKVKKIAPQKEYADDQDFDKNP
jgi:hypothetical protein